jgi:ATP-dependent Clp protease ATP-binding subunit ClpA
MIAQDLEVSLQKAFMDARQKRHEIITVEHLLLALLDNPSTSEVLRACAANIEELRELFTEFINGTPPVTGDEVDTQPTLGFQRVIQRAILHVQASGKKEVTGADVLVAIFGEQDSHAVHFLQQKGVTRSDVVNYVSKQEDVTRIFRMTDSGGVERVIVKDATARDQAAVALIQQRLQQDAEAFRRGDYSDPASSQGADMPGVKDLQAGAAHIRVSYSALPTGAEIAFETTDRHLLTAIHRWFGAQLSKHGPDATSE